MVSLKSIKISAVVLASMASVNMQALAQTASDLLSAIKSSSAAGSDQVRVNQLKVQTIVTVDCSGALSEESIKDRAVTIARLAAQDQGNNAKPLTVLFNDRNNHVKEVSFDQQQLAQLAAGSELMQIAVNDSDSVAVSTAPVAKAAAAANPVATVSASMSSNRYQSDRAKVVEHIDALRTKGVGTTPYIAELQRVDELYKHGGVAQASAGLAKLDATLTEQDRARQQMQIAQAHQASIQKASYNGAAGHVVAAVNGASADYNGTLDGFLQETINSVVAQNVGSFMPTKGAFLIERFRIGKRIHELELRGARVDGYAGLWRNMEEIVAAHDSRRLPELSSDVRYLQSQLGLSQLEGKMTRQLGI